MRWRPARARPIRPIPGHPAEHRVLEDGASGEEQRGSAEDDGDPGRLCVSERMRDDELVADGGGDDAGDHDQVGVYRRDGDADWVGGRCDGRGQQFPGAVDVDPPEQHRGGERHHDRRDPVGREAAAAEGQPGDQDQLAERDDEELPVALGQVLAGDRELRLRVDADPAPVWASRVRVPRSPRPPPASTAPARAAPCATAPAIHGTADTPNQNSCPHAAALHLVATQRRARGQSWRPIWMATYAPAKTRPRSPNASGSAAAITRVPNMVAMTSSCIAGRCGSNMSVSPAVVVQTHHRASSNTSVWKAPLQVKMLHQPLRELDEREDKHQVEEQFQERRPRSPRVFAAARLPHSSSARPFCRLLSRLEAFVPRGSAGGCHRCGPGLESGGPRHTGGRR